MVHYTTSYRHSMSGVLLWFTLSLILSLGSLCYPHLATLTGAHIFSFIFASFNGYMDACI
ncbi:hypothetical protein F4811DRAFT_534921 [Daldinia bambusicola]|nr:hypothetical protein F4811DRAFT_534921 [Daldinia bambusicola]